MKMATATELDRITIVSMLTKAFAEDPYVSWLYSGKAIRMKFWPEVLKTIGGRAISSKTTYITHNISGAALWLPPGISIKPILTPLE